MTSSQNSNATGITLTHPAGTWVVRTADAVIAESTRIVALVEGSSAPVYYFPREDIAMAFLDKTDHQTRNPDLGNASFYSIVSPAGTLPNAAWSYESPSDALSDIKGRLAFWGDEVAIEQL